MLKGIKMDRLDEELALLKNVQRDIQNLNIDIIEKNLGLMTENERLSNQNFDLRTENQKQKASIVEHIKKEGRYINEIAGLKDEIENLKKIIKNTSDYSDMQ